MMRRREEGKRGNNNKKMGCKFKAEGEDWNANYPLQWFLLPYKPTWSIMSFRRKIPPSTNGLGDGV